jgi:hypothetical protein
MPQAHQEKRFSTFTFAVARGVLNSLETLQLGQDVRVLQAILQKVSIQTALHDTRLEVLNGTCTTFSLGQGGAPRLQEKGQGERGKASSRESQDGAGRNSLPSRPRDLRQDDQGISPLTVAFEQCH